MCNLRFSHHVALKLTRPKEMFYVTFVGTLTSFARTQFDMFAEILLIIAVLPNAKHIFRTKKMIKFYVLQ